MAAAKAHGKAPLGPGIAQGDDAYRRRQGKRLGHFAREFLKSGKRTLETFREPRPVIPPPLVRGPSRAVVREVGLRHGLQSIATALPTERKLEWIDAAYAAGQREIEVGSFVPARLLPQLADTAEVLAHAKTLPGLFASVLVPNFKGAERALECGADLMIVPLSASHAHSLANLRKTPDEVVAEVARIRAQRDALGRKTLIEGGVGTAFGCTLQGEVAESEVLRLFEKARALVGECLWCAHFHDTRGMGLANAYAAWQTGIERFDACLAGIGGCPHAPGASGNVATEDLVFMLERMGVHTGLDVPALLALRQRVAGWLAGETLHGTLWQAGLPKPQAAAAACVPAGVAAWPL